MGPLVSVLVSSSCRCTQFEPAKVDTPLHVDRPSDPVVDLQALGEHVHAEFRRFQEDFCAGRESGSSSVAPPRLIIEPGRFVVADSGYLIAKVNTLKDVAGRMFAGIDTGAFVNCRCRLREGEESFRYCSPQASTTSCGLACMGLITTSSI